jgi:uncharacterized protein
VIFLRAPRLGQVKRRLARGIGLLPVLIFYRATAAEIIRRLARDERWQLHLALTPDDAVLPRDWRTGTRMRQGAGDLGARMTRAFRNLPPGPALIVGSDVPDLAPRHLAAAFKALGQHDWVLGPAEDGGYWLIGCARSRVLPRGLFKAVRWSSADALADTRASLPQGQRVALIDRLLDVDDAESYRRLITRRRGAR